MFADRISAVGSSEVALNLKIIKGRIAKQKSRSTLSRGGTWVRNCVMQKKGANNLLPLLTF
jgi:hypothetical protein